MNRIYKSMVLLVIITAALTSCHKKVDDPKPTVNIVTEEGFSTGSKHLFKGTTVKFGFDAKSNELTEEKLAKFRVFVSNGTNIIYDTTYTLNSETSFRCEGNYTFEELGDWQIVGRAYDAANEENSAYINFHVLEDMETPFVWKKTGFGPGEVEGFGDYGLLWNDYIVMDSITADSVTVSYTVACDTVSLMPADTLVSLFLLDAATWDGLESQAQYDALFNKIKSSPDKYNKIEAYKGIVAKGTKTYDDVIAVLNDNEGAANLLIYVSNSVTEEFHEARHLTVTGIIK